MTPYAKHISLAEIALPVSMDIANTVLKQVVLLSVTTSKVTKQYQQPRTHADLVCQELSPTSTSLMPVSHTTSLLRFLPGKLACLCALVPLLTRLCMRLAQNHIIVSVLWA
jgi:hypothetical protein